MDTQEIINRSIEKLQAVWQVEASDVSDRENGFEWVPGSHTVRVEMSENPIQPDRVRIAVETDFISDPPIGEERFDLILEPWAPQITSTYSLVYPQLSSIEVQEPILSLFSSAYVNEELVGWLPEFLGRMAIMQPIDAEIRSQKLVEMLGGGSPLFARGRKEEQYDDILEVANGVFRPAGISASRWIGSADFEQFANTFGRSDQCCANGDPSGLSAEVPFGDQSALIRLRTDQAHPQLGNGLLVTVQLPIRTNRGEIAKIAAQLNFLEARSWTDFPQFGGWHSHPAHDDLYLPTHTSFVPNVLYKGGLGMNFAIWSTSRAFWARKTLWPEAEDRPMWNILEARMGLAKNLGRTSGD